jgi:hypothetical protein
VCVCVLMLYNMNDLMMMIEVGCDRIDAIAHHRVLLYLLKRWDGKTCVYVILYLCNIPSFFKKITHVLSVCME